MKHFRILQSSLAKAISLGYIDIAGLPIKNGVNTNYGIVSAVCTQSNLSATIVLKKNSFTLFVLIVIDMLTKAIVLQHKNIRHFVSLLSVNNKPWSQLIDY